MRVLLPPGWPQPKGYSNGISVRGRMIFVAGVVGWDQEGRFPAGFVAQFRQALQNTLAILAAGQAGAESIVRMTWYVRDIPDYKQNLRDIGRVYRAIIGPHFPAMAVVGVNALVEDAALLEIETTAVVPDSSDTAG